MAKSQTSASILRTIADDKSLSLFKTIAQGTIDSENLKDKTKLTRKQYYSRLSRMTTLDQLLMTIISRNIA
jgi:hypothetical protein